MTKNRALQKDWLRPARMLQSCLETTASPEPFPELPTNAWQKLDRLRLQQATALAHGWMLAAARLRREFERTLKQVGDVVSGLQDAVHQPRLRVTAATLPDLMADLAAIDAEFPEVIFDRTTHVLSVTTEPISIQAVELGSFEIQLLCRELQTGKSSPYRIVALEPNSAVSNDDVTHPHVQSESLCEGDGKQAIGAALAQGRMHDFFVIVANLLRTYNEGSPYVSLDDWFGSICDDCGDLQCSDGIIGCSQCDRGICVDCIDRCAGCDESTCRGCLETCSTCPDECCPGCLSTCVDCDATCCPSCLSESERCPDCHEVHEDSCEDEEAFAAIPEIPTETSPALQAGSAIQSDRVGEAAVPA